MKLHSMRLKHTNHFSDLQLTFDYHDKAITLILGDQGSGKTSLLKHCYQALSWFPARFKDLRGAGLVMSDQDIMQTRIQSRVDIQVQIPGDIGQLPESAETASQDLSLCGWQLYKTLTNSSVGISKVETAQLEKMVELYQHAIRHDPLQGLPLIAYYPVERFVNEINLLSKNNPVVFQPTSAYDQSVISFTTFTRFFEWLREISDVENAQTSQLLHQFLNTPHEKNTHSDLVQAHAQLHAPSLTALKTALHTVIPDLSDFYLQYYPRLQLMACYQGKSMLYQQLPNTIKNRIALVGDIVRRLCLLNPLSLYPCQEGDGILLIDHIDAHLDQNVAQVILERLHQAFPRLQIIATGNRPELLEHAAAYQCLKLEQQNVYPLQTQLTWAGFDSIYANLQLASAPSAESERLDTTMPDPEELWQSFQQLSPEQQAVLLQRIQTDNDASNPETSF